MINQKHLDEWVKASGVSERITQLNVISLDDDRLIDEKLDRNSKRRWKHTAWGGGWWVSGVDPKTGIARGIGGQFKPDVSPDKDRKYFGISDTAATPLFLDTGIKDHWSDLISYRRIPILITEGAKKAGAGLTIKIPTISLPGVTTGQKLGRLKDDLIPFFQVGRRVYLCFDSDIMTKPQVQAALDRLGRLIAETGANVSVVKLPQDTKGMDDHIVKYGGEAFHQLVKTAPTFEEWRDSLKKQVEDGQIETQKTNRQHTLDSIKRIYGNRLRLNNMTKQVELDGKVAKPDHLYLQLMEDGIDSGKEFCCDLFYYLASKNTYHPVQDYLKECKNKYGDSTLHLLDNPSQTYLGTDKDIYNVFVRKTLIGAVARAFKPGCKLDTALILQGHEGKRKTGFFEVLGGEWFNGSLGSNTSDKDEKLLLHSTWIMEWAELETIFSRKELGTVKAFMSCCIDKFRPPFAKSTESFPRHSILCGTTNTDDFLLGSTGTRRFWVVPIPDSEKIKLAKLSEDRDQLWAAAVYAYERGDKWWLTDQEQSTSEEMNQDFKPADTWSDAIIQYTDNLNTISVKEIMEEALKISIDRQDKQSQMRVAAILRNLGWVKKHTKAGKLWTKTEDKGSQVVTETDITGFKGDYLIKDSSHLLIGSHQNFPDVHLLDDHQPQNGVVTSQSQTQRDVQPSVTTMTTFSAKNKQSFPEKIQIGDKVIIKDIPSAKKAYPRMSSKAQTAKYEVTYLSPNDKVCIRSDKYFYELDQDCLYKFEGVNHAV